MRDLAYGRVVVRQSDLASFMYCGMQQHLRALAADGDAHYEQERLSQTLYGTVMHYAGMILQKLRHEGADDALDTALATFEHYWHPDHIGEIAEGTVTQWLPGQTWSGMLQRGRRTLRELDAWLAKDKSTLLGLEYQFTVGTIVDGEPVTLTGTVDRLTMRVQDRTPFISVDDLKTAVKPIYLQQALQWTVYSFASLQAGFWIPFLEVPGFEEFEDRMRSRGVALFEEPPAQDRGHGMDDYARSALEAFGRAGRPELPVAARRGRWLNIRGATTPKPGAASFTEHDCGWRTPAHYARMHAVIREFIKAQRAGVYPLTASGKTCQYCEFNQGNACGGPLAAYQEGIDR